MKKIKELAKSLLYSVIIFFILILIYTIFSYFNIFSSNINNIIKLTLPIVVFFTGGFLVGRKADKNGWFEGIKVSFILSFIMTTILQAAQRDILNIRILRRIVSAS